MIPKINQDLRGHFWQFWGSKKSISRLSQSCFGLCLGSVWALFLASKGLFLGVLWASKVYKWPTKSRFLVKNDNWNRPKWDKCLSTFDIFYRPLELKIQPKVGPLGPKTKPKQFLNKSKTTLRKSRYRFCWPTKSSKIPPQIGHNVQIFDQKTQFLSFIDVWRSKYTQMYAFLGHKSPNNS